MTTDRKPALRLEGIVKTFPGVRALDGVSFEVYPGEVHALMGENGAGKSTLMKVLGGIYQPEEGRIFVDEHRNGDDLAAAGQGQGRHVHPPGTEPCQRAVGRREHLPWRVAAQKLRARRLEDAVRPHRRDPRSAEGGFNARTIVGDLSIANQQMVEIARALTVNARAVIFDEPTASLTDAEKVVLFEVIESLQAEGVGIVYISHRMEEIFKMTDRISVLRDGSYRGTLTTADTNEDEVTNMMIGRSLDLSRNHAQVKLGDVALQVEGLSCHGSVPGCQFRGPRGRGAGLLRACRRRADGNRGNAVRPAHALGRQDLPQGAGNPHHSPIQAIQNGISLVPESRKEQGLVLGMSCRDNITLPQVDDMTAGPFVSDGAEISIYDQYRDKLEIKAPSWRTQVGNLSGGNQQKIVIGKWLSMRPEVLIVDEPTRGIDVGSKAEIHNLLRDLAKQGYAVIVISSEMPEVLHVADRIAAMYHGRLVRTFTSEEVTEDSLIQAISGIEGGKAA